VVLALKQVPERKLLNHPIPGSFLNLLFFLIKSLKKEKKTSWDILIPVKRERRLIGLFLHSLSEKGLVYPLF